MTNAGMELSSSDLQVVSNALQQSARQWEKEHHRFAERARQLAREIDEKFLTVSLNGSIFQLRWVRR